MSKCKIEVVNDTAPDVNADRVYNQLCKLYIGQVQSLKTPDRSRQSNEQVEAQEILTSP